MSDNPYAAPKATQALPIAPRSTDFRKRTAFLDALASAAMVAFFFWCVHVARVMADDAVRRYGHNTDSGAYLYIGALLYCAPGVAAFALAAISILYSWSIHKAVHWVAWAWAALPFVLVALSLLRRWVAA